VRELLGQLDPQHDVCPNVAQRLCSKEVRKINTYYSIIIIKIEGTGVSTSLRRVVVFGICSALSGQAT
jgi:hypothetical protein